MSGIQGLIDDLRAFHAAIDEPECHGRAAFHKREARQAFLEEEFQEIEDALAEDDLAGHLDGLVDLIYFAVGTALIQYGGERLTRAWTAVHEANMAKVDAKTGKVRRDLITGKVLKPAGWISPDIAAIVRSCDDAREADMENIGDFRARSDDLRRSGRTSVGENKANWPRAVTPPLIIAFCGPKGSGKTTAALRLVDAHGFVRRRFAGPIKAMLRAMGLTEAQVDGDEKETPCELLGGKTPREAMMTLGTEWGRQTVANDLWVRAWRASIAGLERVVVDDLRFDNEAETVRALGGYIVEIRRQGHDYDPSHASEAGIRRSLVSHGIRCSEGVDGVRERVDLLVSELALDRSER